MADRNLNPKYVFDSFVVGNSNRMAHAASLAVAEQPAGQRLGQLHFVEPLFTPTGTDCHLQVSGTTGERKSEDARSEGVMV